MRRRNLFATLAIGAISLASYGHTQGAADDELMELYGLFVDAVERVEANYVRPVDRKQLLEDALRGMLAELDPHSSYFSEEEWGQFRKQIEGSFTGIGVSIEIDLRTRQLKVLAPLPGSPAYAAGVLPGDLILEVDGKPTEGMSRDQAVEALQGRPGTQVTLTVRHPRASESETITLSRAIIEMPSVMADARKPDDSWDFMIDKDKKIGYIRITNFVQNTAPELKTALETLVQQGMKGLVLDLRDNPGGLLSSAVEVSDLFLGDGKIVTTKGRNQRDKTYEAEQQVDDLAIPLVILVNQHSASASEIVSAALQDHKRAVIIGERSYGKGSVQNILPLDNGESILKLTVATYWRPSGKNIHRFKGAADSDDWGVIPDEGMEVKLSSSEYADWANARRQRDLISRLNPAKAREVEKQDEEGAKGEQPEAKQPKLHEGIDDKQLDKALDVVASEIKEQAVEAIKEKAAE